MEKGEQPPSARKEGALGGTFRELAELTGILLKAGVDITTLPARAAWKLAMQIGSQKIKENNQQGQGK